MTKDDVLAKFVEHDPEFVQLHGADKIKYYSGSAVIGRVVDIELFNHIKQTNNTLVLDQVEFYE